MTEMGASRAATARLYQCPLLPIEPESSRSAYHQHQASEVGKAAQVGNQPILAVASKGKPQTEFVDQK